MNNIEHFAYPLPHRLDLQAMYKTPYRFDIKIRDYVDYVFSHPKNKYNKIYHNLHTKYDSNDMLKTPYLMTRYYLDYPQQFNHSFDNIAATILVSMWKTFLRLHKHLRNAEFTQYYPADLRMLLIGEGQLLDMLISDIKSNNYILSSDDMVKKRKNIGLRERQRGYSEGQLDYYDSLI